MYITYHFPEGRRLCRCSYSCSPWELVGLTELDKNEFKITGVIFDLPLVLSSHICLLTLSMLFHIKGCKKISTTGPVLDSLEKLYSLGILDGKGQQELKLKDEIP